MPKRRSLRARPGISRFRRIASSASCPSPTARTRRCASYCAKRWRRFRTSATAGASPGSSTACTASRPTPRATSTRRRLTKASACRSSSTRASARWREAKACCGRVRDAEHTRECRRQPAQGTQANARGRRLFRRRLDQRRVGGAPRSPRLVSRGLRGLYGREPPGAARHRAAGHDGHAPGKRAVRRAARAARARPPRRNLGLERNRSERPERQPLWRQARPCLHRRQRPDRSGDHRRDGQRRPRGQHVDVRAPGARIVRILSAQSPMTERKHARTKAYQSAGFLNSKDARALRILSEYLEPKSRFDHHKVDDTIVFMGSARIKSREAAEEMLREAWSAKDRERAQMALKMSAYYEAARELAYRLTTWSKELDREERRFVVCTGGGPGIMEAANRGAAEARGLNVGLTISIPAEEFDNPYVTRELSFHFHYFFMRKFWFAYLAKAVIVFPGGYGTLDELFELLTLVQTRKMKKPMPIVLFGTEYWHEVIDFDALARHATIYFGDIEPMHRTDSVDDAYGWIVAQLAEKALGQPGATL